MAPENSVWKMDSAHHHGHRHRLREKFAKSGFAGWHDYEIVELLLTLAIPRGDVKPLAKALIARFKTLRGILDASTDELRQVKVSGNSRIKTVGEVAPVALRVIREAGNLYLQQSAEQRESLADPDALASFWRSKIGALPNEVFHVAYLDSGLRLLRGGVETLEEGTTDRAAVSPRRVIEAALRRGAAALVCAHNHPNGDVRPSEQDKLLTRALVLAANTVQIKLLDHLIVSPDAVFSFRKEGLL